MQTVLHSKFAAEEEAIPELSALVFTASKLYETALGVDKKVHNWFEVSGKSAAKPWRLESHQSGYKPGRMDKRFWKCPLSI